MKNTQRNTTHKCKPLFSAKNYAYKMQKVTMVPSRRIAVDLILQFTGSTRDILGYTVIRISQWI